MKKDFKNKISGFSLVEVMVAVAIMVMFFLAIYEMIMFANKITANSLRRVEAVNFAQEGIEAVRTIRDNSWTTNLTGVINNTNYYLAIVGGKWAINQTPAPLLNTIFTRTIKFYEVSRDVNGNIVAIGGTVDPKTKKVVSMVSWNERGQTYNVSLETYITNFLDN